jgi:hypothetical protein
MEGRIGKCRDENSGGGWIYSIGKERRELIELTNGGSGEDRITSRLEEEGF